MTEQHATAATAHASRYLQQLCKHWSHRFEVAFDPTAGRIDMGEGVVVSLRATPDTIEVDLTTPLERAEKMREVIENHIRRFAHREPELAFVWSGG
jgi:hypothetical protein